MLATMALASCSVQDTMGENVPDEFTTGLAA